MSSASFAEMFERVLVPAIFRPWAIDFLDRIRPTSNERMLDVGCGTGIVARIARERCGPEAHIVGVDLNPEMIILARSIAPDIEWHQGNALELPFNSKSFDLVLSQQALQFFPDRAAGMREMRRVLDAGGRLAVSTWRPLEENPLFLALHRLATARFGPHVDRRFSFGDPAEINELLRDAGFRHVWAETVTRMECVPDAEKFVALNLDATVDQLAEMSEAERGEALAAFQAEARSTIAPFANGAGLVHPVSANVIAAVL